MSAESIVLPPFPPLSWDECGWTGTITLPSWAGFQSRLGMYGSSSDEAPSNGSARLRVSVPNTKIASPPAPEQCAALDHLFANEAAVAAAVWDALLAYYPDEREAYHDAYDEGEVEPLPEVTDAAGLRQLLGLSWVHVLPQSLGGTAYIGFEFGCVWDEEHGAGVMTHRGRMVKTGQAADSFMGWIAEKDAARTAEKR